VLVLLLTICLAIAWLAFDYGRKRAGFDSAEAEQVRQHLEAQLTEMTLERHRLRDRIAVLERSSQIDAEAARGAQEQINAVQDENLRLQEELTFLRSILESHQAESGIRIHELKIQKRQEDRHYGFGFTVSKLTKNNRTIEGKIYISVRGTQNGEAQEHDLAELTPEGTESLKMRFRYFQNVTGEILLPEGFAPGSFMVNVKPSDRDHPSVTQVFDWSPEE
jgi:hypothetical protein